ncbi:hypothetical protein E3Q02_02184 [Wallemia mellicola]|nr:hypothetical protein E3Q09_02350 [Wallemia mellicola]TIC65388.1 hypothetical protein E3Q02_02184 [Wallemia mellicola]
MSVSLVDPNIRHAHNDQIDQGNGSWIELGYPQDSKDQLILIGKGANGLEGLSDNLPEDQVVFAILLENSSLVQLLWCPDAISGVKKARAMVHARAVASQFDVSKSLPIASTKQDLSVSQLTAQSKVEKKEDSEKHTNGALPSAEESATTVQNLDDDDDSDDDTDSIVNGYQDVNEPDQQEQQRQLEIAKQKALQEEEQRVEIERKRRLEHEQRLLQEAEQKRRLEAEQQKRRELEEKRRKEIEERRKAEQEAKLRLEMEEKRRREAEEKRKQDIIRQKSLEQDRLNKLISSGQVAINGKLSALTKSGTWRRRYFELSSKALAIYKEDLSSKTPIEAIPLSKTTQIVDSYDELLIKHSIRLTSQSDELFIYLDNQEAKSKLMSALQSAIKN